MRLFSCLLLILLFAAGCANIVPPTGGKKDVTPPKLLEVSPKDSLLNTRVTEVELLFDEFVTLNDAAKEIQMSPVLPFPLNSIVVGKKVRVQIPDSLLKDNTTYRLSFGQAVKDLHESNPFKGYAYTFSTGGYFDSMQLNGYVVDAATGKPEGSAQILLYDAESNDSAVVKRKPDYVFTASGGKFIVTGLPHKAFRVYALVEKNGNLVFDEKDEKIGFVDSLFMPHDSLAPPIEFRVFKEISPIDTAKKEEDAQPTSRGKRKEDKDKKILKYTVNVDTNDLQHRTFDITKPVKVTFNSIIDTYDVSKLSLTYDTTDIQADITVSRDTADNTLLLSADWKTDRVYTLRILKDFVTDTLGLTSLPSKHSFRTKSDDDYGIIHVNLPKKYFDEKFIFLVTSGEDTTYNKPITDTTVTLKRLNPGKYSFWIIVDENLNGKWDTGNLFAKEQPEVVLPHNTDTELKAAWENVIDFTEPLHEPRDKKVDKKGEKPKEDK